MNRRTLKIKKNKTTFSTVMLIDDNEMDNFMNQKIIEANDFADIIYTNTNGLSALEFLKNLSLNKTTQETTIPEVIFVDLNMPVMNGFQFIRKFYELPHELTEKSKILILTSSLNPDDKETASQINQDITFLYKPLTAENLAIIS